MNKTERTVLQECEQFKQSVDEYIGQLAGKTDKNSFKAYRCDLKHFVAHMANKSYRNVTDVNTYISELYNDYKPITVKRKIASIRLFYKYLAQRDNYFECIVSNISGCTDKFPPKYETATLDEVKKLFQACNSMYKNSKTDFQEFVYLRNIVILQMMFSTGITAEELCECRPAQVNIKEKSITLSNGIRERVLSLENGFDMDMLKLYVTKYKVEIDACGYLFLGRYFKKMEEQAVRKMIASLSREAGLHRAITPSMLRNAFIDISLEMGTDAKLLKDVLGLNSYHIITNHQERLKRIKEEKIVYNNPLSLI